MRKFCLILSILGILSSTVFSQTATERVVIKGGSSAWDNFIKEVYRYPTFQPGIVEYKDGKRYKSNFNYNKVIGNIQFIDEKGDTLALSNEETISSIIIGSDIFIYNPQCLISLKTDGKVKLYKNERVRIADQMKTGAYDIPNTAGTIDAINHTDSWLAQNMLDINESLLISKVTNFYIENERKEIVPASRKNVLNMFSRHEDELKQFIKSNGIDFTKEEDLEELTGYLSRL
jgi:hypothetical protein